MIKNKMNKTFLAFTILLFVSTVAHAQVNKRQFPIGEILSGIQQRTDSLVYISEEDWDVNVFIIGRNVSVLNAETFLAANPFVAFQPIEKFDIDLFFARLEQQDGRWTILRNYLEANLTQLQVFKVGNVRRDVYVIGLFNGHIVGIRTFAVET